MKVINYIAAIIAVLVMLTGCNNSLKTKETYLENRIPMLKENLSESEYKEFVEIMDFDKKGNLNVMNFDLLKKGTSDKYDSIQYRISSDMIGFYDNIISVDSLGIETFMGPELVTYTTIDGKKVNIADFTKKNTIYLITSVNCGPCLEFFEEANKIASNPENKDFQFIALYGDPAIRMENYRKGTGFKRFGILDEHWIQFNNEQNIIQEIKQMYKGKRKEFEIGEGFPELFYYQKGKFVSNLGEHKLQDILNELKKTLDSNAPESNI